MIHEDLSDYSRYDHNHNDLYNDLSVSFYEGHPFNYSSSSEAVSYQFTGYPIMKS